MSPSPFSVESIPPGGTAVVELEDGRLVKQKMCKEVEVLRGALETVEAETCKPKAAEQ